MPERTLYLFDTFKGLDRRDLEAEKSAGLPEIPGWRYSDAKTESLLNRLPNPEKAVIKEGWFPETAFDLEEEKFALAWLDAGLYAPTLAALKFFFPRMSQGGVIVLCGMADPATPGVSKALQDLEAEYGAFLLLPMGDLKGTAVIIHP